MTLDQIATGEFDTNDAIRYLATTLIELVPTVVGLLPDMTDPAADPEPPRPIPPPSLSLYTHLGRRVASALVAAGYATGSAVAFASDDELLSIDGIGPATLRTIRAHFTK